MIHLLLIWLLSSLALLIVAYIVPGFELASFGSALMASIVVGFLNATLGFLLKLLTFPISILTLGIFFLVINAIILLLASALVPGFHIRGFWAAFLGAIVLMLVRMVFNAVLRS
ncbi:MAG TPA: phage holin family protein [Acidobacteriaceae bacterium]|nr:phage holin family protein [Acidobacteriaceae bacterium]